MSFAIELEGSFYELIPNGPFLFARYIKSGEFFNSARWQNRHTQCEHDLYDVSCERPESPERLRHVLPDYGAAGVVVTNPEKTSVFYP